jgi:putative chitinase
MNLKEILAKIYPDATDANIAKYADALVLAMQLYDINTPYRRAAFLAQIGHESGQLAYCVENLNYSSAGLRKTFPKYFPTDALAVQYARKPEAIANRVYANRMGNGTEASGDGWKFRGRGLLQITGRSNYFALNDKMRNVPIGTDFTLSPELLEQPYWAAMSAAWWWSNAKLNYLADKLSGLNDYGTFEAITKTINGGYNGIADRWKIYQRARMMI